MNSFQAKMNTATQILGVLMVFVLIFPTALENAVMILMLASYFLSGNYAEKWSRIRSVPVARISLLLFGIFAVGMAYSSANIGESLKSLKMYQELLIFPIVLSLFDSEYWRRRAYYAFFWAIGFGVLLSFFMYLGWLPHGKPEQDWVPFKGRIAFGFFLAFAVYLMVHHAALAGTLKHRAMWSIFATLVTFDLLFLISGRTGHIVLIAMLALLLMQYRHWVRKYWIVVVLVITAVGTTAILTSPAINSRANDIELAIDNPESSSAGLRLIFWQTSLRIVADHPLFGAGTGSFANEFLTHANEHAKLKADNPHNEYLLIASQLGLAGLSAFIWLLYRQFQLAKQLPERYGLAAQGLVVAMAVGCLFNSFLRDHGEGHFYAIYAGLLFSTFLSRQKKAS